MPVSLSDLNKTYKIICLIRYLRGPHHRFDLGPPGQFAREPVVQVYDVHEGLDPLKKEATMEVKGNRLQVTR